MINEPRESTSTMKRLGPVRLFPTDEIQETTNVRTNLRRRSNDDDEEEDRCFTRDDDSCAKRSKGDRGDRAVRDVSLHLSYRPRGLTATANPREACRRIETRVPGGNRGSRVVFLSICFDRQHEQLTRWVMENLLESIEFRALSDNRMEEALAIQRESMMKENVALAVGMFEAEGSAEEMQLVFREVAKDGCSIAAFDKRTDEMIGVCFNKLHVPMAEGTRDRFAVFLETNITREPCKGLVNFLGDIESSVDLYQHYGADCLIEAFYIGTKSNCSRRGIGFDLVEATIDHASRMDGALQPKVIFGVFTSSYSQRIATRLNFDWLATIRYDDYSYKGRKFSDVIPSSHPSAMLGALRLR